MIDLVTLEDVEAAARRIAGRIRRTTLLDPSPVRVPIAPGRFDLRLKLECQQVGGSFKVRGALNRVLSLPGGLPAAGLVTASGGNHGVAVACAAATLGIPAKVFLPSAASPMKAEAARRWGAECITVGQVWDDANAEALAVSEREGAIYVHPFADPQVIAGQGTIVLEVMDELPAVDTLLVAVGGGGLIGGIATAAKALRPGIRIVGIEPTGAPTLTRAIKAAHPVTLPAITTRAATLAPRRTMAINLDIARDLVDRMVLVSDAEMQAAAEWLWEELGIAVELAGAAALAALATGRYVPEPNETVVALICGAGIDGIPDLRG